MGVRAMLVVGSLLAAQLAAELLMRDRWNLHWTAAGHRVVAATLARELLPR